MCDKLQLGCVVVGGGTVAMLQNKRFLALTPSHPASHLALPLASVQRAACSAAYSWQHGSLMRQDQCPLFPSGIIGG
jgi:hypothetical protein